MDLNYLYHRHGISLQLAENAACDCSRLAHEAFARAYAAQIAEARCLSRLPPSTTLQPTDKRISA